MAASQKEMGPRNRLALALDTDPENALDLFHRTKDVIGIYKIHWQLFLRSGPGFVERIRRAGCDVFLDFKLHDIPNTVGSAVETAASLGAKYLTVHALGGREMMSQASAAALSAAEHPGQDLMQLLAVTILTHHTGEGLEEIGLSPVPVESVERLSLLASSAGVPGIVCSAEEAEVVREALGPEALIVCPGIRPAGAALGDQVRTKTPKEAVLAGADILVVGRPIRTAPDPAAAAAAILDEMASAMSAS